MLISTSEFTTKPSLIDFKDNIKHVLFKPARTYQKKIKIDSNNPLTALETEIEMRLLEAASESSKTLRTSIRDLRKPLHNASQFTNTLSASNNSSSYMEIFEEWHEIMQNCRGTSVDRNNSESLSSELNMDDIVARRSSVESNDHLIENTTIEPHPNNKISNMFFYSSAPFAAAAFVQHAVLLIHPLINKDLSANLLLITYSIAGVLLILSGLYEKIPDQPSIASICQNEHELA